MESHVATAVDAVFARLHASGYDSLNELQCTLLCVWAAVGEIDNGGFEQFFFNRSGDWATGTVTAFVRIGAPSLAQVVKDAISVFPGGGPSRELDTRREQLNSLSPQAINKLAKQDDRFDSNNPDVDPLINAFVEGHYSELHER